MMLLHPASTTMRWKATVWSMKESRSAEASASFCEAMFVLSLTRRSVQLSRQICVTDVDSKTNYTSMGSRTSRSVSPLTRAPRLGYTAIHPSSWSFVSALRTGVRLMPRLLAICGSLVISPGEY